MKVPTSGPLLPVGDEDEYLGWGGWSDRKSMSVAEQKIEFKVTYPNTTGGKPFRVIFRQKPNPIGFHARMPG